MLFSALDIGSRMLSGIQSSIDAAPTESTSGAVFAPALNAASPRVSIVSDAARAAASPAGAAIALVVVLPALRIAALTVAAMPLTIFPPGIFSGSSMS